MAPLYQTGRLVNAEMVQLWFSNRRRRGPAASSQPRQAQQIASQGLQQSQGQTDENVLLCNEYITKENETPTSIGKKVGMKAAQIIALNAQLFPCVFYFFLIFCFW
jgi:hypothetical protein